MKPRKSPARKPGAISITVKIQILDWLLRGHRGVASDPKVLKKELGILNKLLKSYPSSAFWLSLRVGLDLQSLCFFLSQTGKAELEKKWRLFQFEKSQGKAPKNPLDSISNFPMLAEDLCFVEGEEPTQNTTQPEPPRRKTSALDWADSSTE
jgi:hypothetical protein